VVWLSDSVDHFLSRGVSRDSGRFDLPRLVGSTRLHVQRIGFRPKTVHIGETDSLVDVSLTPVALQLAAMQARDRRVCPGKTGDTTAFELWDQARAALWASVIAREIIPPVIKLRSYTETYAPATKHMVDQTIETKQVEDDRSYVAGHQPSQFARDGYMSESASGTRTYFAPDEWVLFDTSFVETHCLHAVMGDPTHTGQVGVAFDPIETADRDTLVDVKGVLWIDTERRRLTTLEFTYTGLEPAEKGAGGVVHFTLSPRGTAIVDLWQIHAMQLGTDERSPRRGLPRRYHSEYYVVKGLLIGGEIVSITWSDHGELPYPRVVGTVVDSARQPVAGARVWLYGGKDTVVSNASGKFELPPKLPGDVVVLASDSALAGVGISRAIPRHLVTSGKGDFNVELEYHSRSAALASICPGLARRKAKGVVITHVVDVNGAGVPKASVDVVLDPRAAPAGASGNVLHTETDDQGSFTLCGTVVGYAMSVRATKGGAVGQAELTTWDGDFAALQIVVRP
jgi:hypothetical protein